jgi:drug/metabolite transporter (DMT)-like permease
MYIFSFAAASLWLLGIVGGDRTLWLPPLDRTGWLLLVGLSAGPTLFGYALFTSSLRYLPATVAGLLTTLEPPLAALMAIPLLGRTMSGLQWLGTALIVCAVATVRTGGPSRRSADT